MCLLIHKPKDSEFNEEHLTDFYQRNRDGIGAMYAEDGFLKMFKLLPNTAQDVLDFYEKYIKGRECAIHFRMRTHGDIDHENCHPYPVFGFDEEVSDADMPMLLMHNGVLHTGNAADKTKSDTWHYIRDYLRKLLKHDPGMAFSPEFKDIIGKHIGNNRFILMNHAGEMAIINRAQGTEFKGAWMSNEYAWSASKYLPSRYYTGTSKGGKTYTSAYEDYSKYKTPFGTSTAKNSTPPTTTAAGGGKSRKAPKRQSKKQQLALPMLPSTSSGGKSATRISPARAAANESSGVSVDCAWLDDILELRSILDSFHPKNGTSNKQLECFIEEVGVTYAYFALELLGENYISEEQWDKMVKDRTIMRRFGDTPKEDWYTTGAASLATM